MTNDTTERRFTAGRVEVRASGDSGVTIGGYAAKFNTLSQNLGGFVETIAPGFFDKSRGDGWPDVLARYNHDDNRLLGTVAAGTLRLNVDNIGLSYDVDLPRSRGDVAELVERGDVNRSSFAFRVFKDEWGTTDQDFPQRTLISGSLHDVAPVNVPAYLDTSAGLRSLAEQFDAEYEEVRSMSAAGDLMRFFRRTDKPSEQKTSAAAMLAAAKAIKV